MLSFEWRHDMRLKRLPRGTTSDAQDLAKSFSERSTRQCSERPRIQRDTRLFLLMCARPLHAASPIQFSFVSEMTAWSFLRSFMGDETRQSGKTGPKESPVSHAFPNQ